MSKKVTHGQNLNLPVLKSLHTILLVMYAKRFIYHTKVNIFPLPKDY
mgnify:CR=1 FL=1